MQQRQYHPSDRAGRWLQIMGPAGEDGLDLSQDARVLVTRLDPGERVSHDFAGCRSGYAYVIEGAAAFDGDKLTQGDAAKIEGPHQLSLQAAAESELILIDVPLHFRP